MSGFNRAVFRAVYAAHSHITLIIKQCILLRLLVRITQSIQTQFMFPITPGSFLPLITHIPHPFNIAQSPLQPKHLYLLKLWLYLTIPFIFEIYIYLMPYTVSWSDSPSHLDHLNLYNYRILVYLF